MAIYERGYRPYEGAFRTTPGWWIVAREGWSVAFRHKGVRWLGLIVLLLAAGSCVYLFVSLGVQQTLGQLGGKLGGAMGMAEKSFGQQSAEQLVSAQWWFYEFSTFLSIFTGIMVGCGLIADDMRSRALTLYLVRPITRTSYVLGKALILPGIFLVLCLVPGLMLWLMVGLWQPPGETSSFLADNAVIAQRALGHYLVVAGSVTGLMLLLSSVTPRRGVALAIGAAVVLLGGILARIGRLLPGMLGDIGSALSIPRNALRELRLADGKMTRWLPTQDAVVIVTVALFVAGLVAVAWRARTTEVSE